MRVASYLELLGREGGDELLAHVHHGPQHGLQVAALGVVAPHGQVGHWPALQVGAVEVEAAAAQLLGAQLAAHRQRGRAPGQARLVGRDRLLQATLLATSPETWPRVTGLPDGLLVLEEGKEWWLVSACLPACWLLTWWTLRNGAMSWSGRPGNLSLMTTSCCV